MKYRFLILSALVLLLVPSSAIGAKDRNVHRVMTCNIRVTGLEADEGWPGRPWDERKDVCLEVIRSYAPDIICMQEVVYDSDAFMEKNLKGYFAFGFSGPEMDPYVEGYHNIAKNVIFFKESRYEFISSGSYWLSETPLIAGSCSWNTNRARHCNWVRIRDRRTGAEFRVLNVHLDHKSEEARRNQSVMIAGEAGQYMKDFPQILCGDFNAGRTQKAVSTLVQAGWNDVYSSLHEGDEDEFTCHIFQGPDYKPKGPAKRIDFILTSGLVTPVSSSIVKDSKDGIYPSDHYFLVADLRINPENE